ncbi:MAG: hypothetical protein WBW81_13945 [Methylocella sp.]
MLMSFPEAMKWFSATVVSILGVFAFVEKFSSKEDLEKYHRLITENRFKFSAQWYLLLIKFVDVFFGFHQYRRLILPSVLRVAGYTFCTTAIIFFVVGSDILIMTPFLILIAIPGNFVFDYFNFLKTRLVLVFVAKHRTFKAILFGVLMEISLLILLYIISVLITIAIFFIALYSFTYISTAAIRFFPDSIVHSKIFKTGYMLIFRFFQIALDPSSGAYGSNLVYELFYDARNTNIIAASLSTIIIILFIVATIASYIAKNISMLQQFLDRHTAVLDKPIQTLGAMVVVIFAVLFWTWFGLHQLVTALMQR